MKLSSREQDNIWHLLVEAQNVPATRSAGSVRTQGTTQPRGRVPAARSPNYPGPRDPRRASQTPQDLRHVEDPEASEPDYTIRSNPPSPEQQADITFDPAKNYFLKGYQTYNGTKKSFNQQKWREFTNTFKTRIDRYTQQVGENFASLCDTILHEQSSEEQDEKLLDRFAYTIYNAPQNSYPLSKFIPGVTMRNPQEMQRYHNLIMREFGKYIGYDYPSRTKKPKQTAVSKAIDTIGTVGQALQKGSPKGVI